MFKKIGKYLLSATLVFASVLAASGCGKNDDDKDKGGGGSGAKESLTWIEKMDDLKAVFKTASENYTMTVKDINFTVDASEDSYGDPLFEIKNVEYASSESYKIIIEDDAYLFDAGDKKEAKANNDDDFLSYGSELALSNKVLKQYNYVMTEAGWTVEEVEDLDYESNAVSAKRYSIAEELKNLKREIYFGAAWNSISNTIYHSEKEMLDEIASWYDSSSSTFKVTDDFDLVIQNGGYYSGVTYNSDKFYANNGFKYLSYDEDYEGYDEVYFNELRFLNVNFKLDGQKLSSLSYDVYLCNESYYTTTTFKGLHVEFTNIGNSVITVGNNLQADRTSYTGGKVIDLALDAARTFYNEGNYTVSYKAEFTEYNDWGFESAPEYEHVLKTTATSASEYLKYYDMSSAQIKEIYWIQEKIDDTTYAQYQYDFTSETWYKRIYSVAQGQTTDEMFASYKSYYWNTEEDSNGGFLNIGSGLTETIKYSETLKSYLFVDTPSVTATEGEDDLKFTTPIDAVYNFDTSTNKLNYYVSRHKAKYQPDGAYSHGYMIKTIDNIGSTVIEIPADFVLVNE